MAGTITIIAGATYSDTITIKDSDRKVIDITGLQLKIKIAKSVGIGDKDANYYADSDESGSDLTIAGGIGVWVMPDSVSKDLEGGLFKWQVRYIDASSTVNDTDQGDAIIDRSLFDDE